MDGIEKQCRLGLSGREKAFDPRVISRSMAARLGCSRATTHLFRMRVAVSGRMMMGRLSRSSVSALAIAVLVAGSAEAHDTWANGAAIPEWVRRECCDHADAHHLRPEWVHPQKGGGYVVDGIQDEIPFWLVIPSQDGEFWAFYAQVEGQQFLRCFFAPKPAA